MITYAMFLIMCFTMGHCSCEYCDGVCTPNECDVMDKAVYGPITFMSKYCANSNESTQ